MPGSGLLESRALLGFMPSSRAPPARRGSAPAEHRHLVVRPGRRARRRARLARRPRHRRRFHRSRFPASATSAASSAPSSTPPIAARLRAAIGERGVDYVGQDIVRLSTTPRVGERRPRAAPFRAARLRRRDAGRLARHARRLLPHFRPARRARRLDGRGRRNRPTSGCSPTSPVETTTPAAAARQSANRAPARQSAEPRRRQSVLARPLSRTRRSDAAARALPLRPRRWMPTRRAKRAPVARPAEATARRVGRGRGRRRPSVPRRRVATRACATKRITARRCRSRAPRAAPHRSIRERLSQDTWQLIGRARIASRRRLADDRSPKPRSRSHRRRRCTTLRRAFRPARRKLQSRRGLELSRHGAAHRTRHQYMPASRGNSPTARRRADNLDVLLDLIDSQITYRSRYLIGVALAPVRDMALLDPFNPRSVAFQVARIDDHLASLPSSARTACSKSRADRHAAARRSCDEDADGIDAGKILGFEQRLIESRRRDRRALFPARAASCACRTMSRASRDL